jgi:hypothetical protein
MKWYEWWWVAVFVAAAGGISYFAIDAKNISLKELSFRLGEMEKERMVAAQEKEELKVAAASQSDPAWIEMVLMRDLGLVPEGWLKVHFKR